MVFGDSGISVGTRHETKAVELRNTLNGAEAMVRMLEAHGVRHMFGLCGDTTLPFYDALNRLDHPISHILTRDERSAAYMADAYARVTGRVGVCEGPSGGGATYILPGLIEAGDILLCGAGHHHGYLGRLLWQIPADRARSAGVVRAADQMEHGDPAGGAYPRMFGRRFAP